MSNELACTFEDFKKRGKEFIDAAPTCTLDELDSMWKMIALSYLNLDGLTPSDEHQAPILLKILGMVAINRQCQLDCP